MTSQRHRHTQHFREQKDRRDAFKPLRLIKSFNSSKLSIPIKRKLNDSGMSEKYHLIFQNIKNVWSTVSFSPWQNMKHEGQPM